MKRTILAAVATSVLLAAAPAWADRGTAILGAAIGGAAGAVVGREVGGPGGAVLGAALGGAAGVAVTQNLGGYGRDRVQVREPAYVTPPAFGYGGYGGYGRPGYRRADVGNHYWLDGRDRDRGWDHDDRRHHDRHHRHHHGHGFDRGHR
ncbi:MAG: hypothetical protein HY778_05740 [Betaproteobacteria bacterium]|nr:hypothetical protein [Betaproteobacteria bacterium]